MYWTQVCRLIASVTQLCLFFHDCENNLEIRRGVVQQNPAICRDGQKVGPRISTNPLYLVENCQLEVDIHSGIRDYKGVLHKTHLSGCLPSVNNTEKSYIQFI